MGAEVFFEIGTLYFRRQQPNFWWIWPENVIRVGNTASGGGGEEGHGWVYMEHKLGGNM
jgi:hypothetical protein